MTAMEVDYNWNKPRLLSRDNFRESVFTRDRYLCVFCSNEAMDAHHIIERRLWPDGGYYLDNGASVCHPCHYKCEQTVYTVEQVRDAAKIKNKILPDCLYSDRRYDKWGNEYVSTDTRCPGPLFWDESVRKVIVGDFVEHIKYPRTLHLPWSLFADSDDKIIQDTSHMEDMDIVVTEKLDGENTTMYTDYIHARSLDYSPHPSRSHIKALHAKVGWQIPRGMRICGENVTAVHTIEYSGLKSYFFVFSIWEGGTCLSWKDTEEWCKLLELETVPVLYRGKWDEKALRKLSISLGKSCAGYVVRPEGSFHLKDFKDVVLKYRGVEILGNHHWMAKQVVYNKLGA